jgi:hypothetical protein
MLRGAQHALIARQIKPKAMQVPDERPGILEMPNFDKGLLGHVRPMGQQAGSKDKPAHPPVFGEKLSPKPKNPWKNRRSLPWGVEFPGNLATF